MRRARTTGEMAAAFIAMTAREIVEDPACSVREMENGAKYLSTELPDQSAQEVVRAASMVGIHMVAGCAEACIDWHPGTQLERAELSREIERDIDEFVKQLIERYTERLNDKN